MLGKIKRYKKIIIGAVGIFVVLFICYLIGQNVVLPSRLAKEGLLSYSGNVPEFSFIQNSHMLFYENQEQSEEYPGGQNVGPITIDENQEGFLIVPKTAIRYDVKLTREMKTLSFVAGYHPTIEVGVADGAELKLQVISLYDETILAEEDVYVAADGSDTIVKFDLSAYKGKEVRIRISCESGSAGDYNGDWIVLENLVLESQIVEGLTLDKTEEISRDASKSEESSELGVVVSLNEEFTIKEAGRVSTSPNINVVNNVTTPVLEQGEDGEWDDTDCLNPSVINFNNQYYNYYSGFDGQSWATGLAVSEDGKTWEKYEGNPVLWVGQAGLDNEYIAANGSAVVIDNKVYYYYQGVADGKAYIALATSEDGKTFTKHGEPILQADSSVGAWDEAGVADPYVIEYDGLYYMYYLGMNNVAIQRLGVAVSEDGIHWIKSVANPILDVGAKDTFDENGLGEPSVVYHAPYFYMFYTGRDAKENRNIGYALSVDGINWKKYSTDGLVDFQVEWNSKVICDTTFLLDAETGLLDVWYGGGNIASPDENLNGKIGLFTVDLAKGRDATRIDNNTENREELADLVKGAYIEPDKIWASKEVECSLLNDTEKKTIVVEVYVPFELHEQSVEKLDIIIEVNGCNSKEFSFDEGGIYELAVECETQTEWLDIVLMANNAVTPEGDKRSLSYMINSVYQK